MIALTSKQVSVLAFIESYMIAESRPPTLSDISKHFGWSSLNSAHTHLQYLKAKGYVEIRPLSRGIRILRPAPVPTLAPLEENFDAMLCKDLFP